MFAPLLAWLLDWSVAIVGAVFLLLVASVYWPGRSERLQRHALIPFDDDN